MKLVADLHLLKALGTACTYAYSTKYSDTVTETFIRNASQSLILKLNKGYTRISQALAVKRPIVIARSGKMTIKKAKRKTVSVTVNDAQLYVLKLNCELYGTMHPDSEHVVILHTDFFSQINQ
jgi:hypothetical protein